MNQKNKTISLFLVIIVILFFLAAGLMKKNISNTITPAVTADQNKTIPEKISKSTPVKKHKNKFSTNDEIKNEYGKLETVILWSGKRYTGAVISSDKIYSIVTVDGIIDIPMNEVKIREIIR